MLTAMRREEHLERLEEGRSLASLLEQFPDLLLVLVGHGGNDGFLVFEIAIDQAHTDTGFGTDVVHARLVKAAFGEGDDGRFHDLVAPIDRAVSRSKSWRHLGLVGCGTMNERSFIVK